MLQSYQSALLVTNLVSTCVFDYDPRDWREVLVAKTDEKLIKLCKGVRAIGHGAEVRIKPSEIISDEWSIMIFVGGAIISFTDFLPIEEALDQALSKLASISSRMMAAIRQGPPPSSEPPFGDIGDPVPETPVPKTPRKKS